MPHRDAQAALEARRDELRRDLADAARHADALADALREKERLGRELAAVEARLVRARARRLPLLANIRVASPCSASWEAMTGDDRVRFCGSCQKNVYNLSAMESAEAEALLAQHGASLCVRFYERPDGTVMTADCPVGVRRKRVKRAVLAVAGASALAASASAFLVRAGEPSARVVMGAPPVTSVPTPVATATATAESTAAWTMGSAEAAPTAAPRPHVKMGAPARVPRTKTGRIDVDF